ncbi:nucleotidyltransferase domain-containing protein [Archaeoglobus veneficus]|uniref:DNA polymerase beta domain protein region n=1 Tax=Archaeoglobus veneficus (strain DSM 11195 / SNP6) TaxID=693661 RepID=F2KQN6_ARCVS|nr:nucleotidyltransferase domain-containing protein [Archaeoglobus veneficus]AEA46598.1 DNA polymerase beta domain protein region [Archaeoglobus veneficus SNP6]
MKKELKELLRELREDFREFATDCLGVLLYGSYARGEETKRSDVDVCLVMPSKQAISRVFGKLGGKYDIKVFEELPLYIRVDIVRNHVKVYSKDELDLYLYRQMKIWKDMEHRIKENSFESIEEKLRLRRRWLNEKKKILGKT